MLIPSEKCCRCHLTISGTNFQIWCKLHRIVSPFCSLCPSSAPSRTQPQQPEPSLFLVYLPFVYPQIKCVSTPSTCPTSKNATCQFGGLHCQAPLPSSAVGEGTSS